MDLPELSCLDGLTRIGFGGGVDMRPTLIRVLTDLYVQKLQHTADEQRHYTELALRLLEGVDATTRAAVAVRLSRHLSPPVRVIQYLARDLPEVAAPLRGHPLLQPPQPTAATAQPSVPAEAAAASPRPSAPAPSVQPVETEPTVTTTAPPLAEAEAAPAPMVTAPSLPIAEPQLAIDTPHAADDPYAIDAATAGDLDEQFFAADEHERRLILLNLHIVAPIPAGHVVVPRDPAAVQRLEKAALGRNRDDFAASLADALRVSPQAARRVARDSLGEPLAVALKALGAPRDIAYRILMFVNPAVGHSVARVHALAALYDDMAVPAAEAMVAIWQAASPAERAAPKHLPLSWNDETRARARATPATERRAAAAAAPHTAQRRDAS